MEEKSRKNLYGYTRLFFLLVLVIYPLRHARMGVDLWDGGYNCANFCYPGPEYMDPMWYFATWLANGVGSFFTKLPFGHTMWGMNLYAGLVVSGMAAAAFWFYVTVIKMPDWLAFIAEMISVSLCWAPVTVLYSYLTYALLLTGSIFLYQGMIKENHKYLLLAGVALGLNVGVRFSNLAQMGMILALWIYAASEKFSLQKGLRETGWCVLGYVIGLLLFLTPVSVRFGGLRYLEGVLGLFQMTESAQDYKLGHMIAALFGSYYEGTYWLKRCVLAVFAGMAAVLALPKRWTGPKRILVLGFTAAAGIWLSKSHFYERDYASYQAVFYPCVAVFTWTALLALYYLFQRKSPGERRLLALFLVLTIGISALGGNNAVYASINNTFLVLPGFLWLLWCFCREERNLLFFPLQSMLLLCTLFLTVQSLLFGGAFIYEEAAGVHHQMARIEKVPALAGMYTDAEKASALEELYQYLQDHHLVGRKTLLYGQIPGMAFYMKLPPALNVWSDLRSYRYEVMEKEMERLEEEANGGGALPLVLMPAEYGGGALAETEGITFPVFPVLEETEKKKFELVCTFMERFSYQMVFRNRKFVVFMQKNPCNP